MKIKKIKESTIADVLNAIESLAISTAKGFAETATKTEFHEVAVRIETRLDDIDFRLGKIESNHERRIDILEDKMRIVFTAFERQLKVKLSK